jgi:hypothetical protein
MIVAWISAALLLVLLIPSHRLFVRQARRRVLHDRIHRRLGAVVGSVDARPSPALIRDRFRR